MASNADLHYIITQIKGYFSEKVDRSELGDAASMAVANNLTTTASGSVLDARQGVVLNNNINSLNDSLATKKTEEYGLFVDERESATTGYWHKMFTCKTKIYNYSDINIKLSVMALYSAATRPIGELVLNIRQNLNGEVTTVSNAKLNWISCNRDVLEFLNRFAINIVADSTGNYVELYIYNNVRYLGYKVVIDDKEGRGWGSDLDFTGYVTHNATTTLTTLPTNGTIVYSKYGKSALGGGIYVTNTSWLPTDIGLIVGQSCNIITTAAVTSAITGGKFAYISKGTLYCISDDGYDLVAQAGSGTGASLFTIRYQNASWTTSSVGSIAFT